MNIMLVELRAFSWSIERLIVCRIPRAANFLVQKRNSAKVIYVRADSIWFPSIVHTSLMVKIHEANSLLFDSPVLEMTSRFVPDCIESG